MICGEVGVEGIEEEMFEGGGKIVDWTRTAECAVMRWVLCCLLVLLIKAGIVGDMAVERD